MSTIISIANTAASVGKTTTAVNLAVELSMRGRHTLLIDADPQAHATRFFMREEQIMWTLADTLCRPQPGSRHNFGRWDVFAPSDFSKLHIVPSDIRLATCEGKERAQIADLKAHLATIERSYEFIVIDTPSSLEVLTPSCLHAATHVLAPVSPGGQSQAGLQLLSDYVGRMSYVTRPIWLGVVCNRFDCRSHESGTFYENLTKAMGAMVCETIIHRDDVIEQSAERHEIVAGRRSGLSSLAAAALYIELVDELLSRLEEGGNKPSLGVN